MEDFKAQGPLELSVRVGELLLWRIQDTGDGWTGVERRRRGADDGERHEGYVPTSFCSFEADNDTQSGDEREVHVVAPLVAPAAAPKLAEIVRTVADDDVSVLLLLLFPIEKKCLLFFRLR